LIPVKNWSRGADDFFFLFVLNFCFDLDAVYDDEDAVKNKGFYAFSCKEIFIEFSVFSDALPSVPIFLSIT